MSEETKAILLSIAVIVIAAPLLRRYLGIEEWGYAIPAELSR